MHRLLSGLLLITSLAIVRVGKASEPLPGSKLPPDEIACFNCHGEADLWTEEKARFHISEESLAEDVHFLNGVNCHDCHGGDPDQYDAAGLHAKEDGFVPLAEMQKSCAKCHKDQAVAIVKGVHARAGDKDERGRGTPLSCGQCHGKKLHGLLPVADTRSPVHLENQVQTCGGCHPDDLRSYRTTVHGQGLFESGLVVTATCANCHGAHGVFYAADKRSTLNRANVADTCTECHQFIRDTIQTSVHAGGGGLGTDTAMPAPGGRIRHKPTCTSCHQGHRLQQPESESYRSQLSYVCGNCHVDLATGYRLSLHGQLTRLGYAPAAECADCHGSHDIASVSNPVSSVAPGESRLETCRKCHTYAVPNFSDFNPHADYKDEEHFPTLHAFHTILMLPLNIALAACALHAFLWFFRSFIHAFAQGRDKPLTKKSVNLIRFERYRRVPYGLLMISILGLILTGLPLKYGSYAWVQAATRAVGGFKTTSILHHFFAVLLLYGVVAHLVYAIRNALAMRKKGLDWKAILFHPDSPIPNWRDVKDFMGMARWFGGSGKKPTFERWTYWEKSDYWAMCAAMILVASSGLMLWFPNLFCRILPGEALNVAKMAHSEITLYAVGLLLLVHLFNTHFRPEKFPMDISALTGLVSEEHLQRARPDYIERMKREGTFDQVRRPAPSARRLALVILGGTLMFAVALGLLAVLLLVSLGK